MGSDRPSGVSGLDADPRAPAPGPGAPDLRGALQRPSPASGARTRCAAGRLRGFVADPPAGGPPTERTRRADPRVSRGGGIRNQSFGPPTRLSIRPDGEAMEPLRKPSQP